MQDSEKQSNRNAEKNLHIWLNFQNHSNFLCKTLQTGNIAHAWCAHDHAPCINLAEINQSHSSLIISMLNYMSGNKQHSKGIIIEIKQNWIFVQIKKRHGIALWPRCAAMFYISLHNLSNIVFLVTELEFSGITQYKKYWNLDVNVMNKKLCTNLASTCNTTKDLSIPCLAAILYT